jgi:hypothetical protein
MEAPPDKVGWRLFAVLPVILTYVVTISVRQPTTTTGHCGLCLCRTGHSLDTFTHQIAEKPNEIQALKPVYPVIPPGFQPKVHSGFSKAFHY